MRFVDIVHLTGLPDPGQLDNGAGPAPSPAASGPEVGVVRSRGGRPLLLVWHEDGRLRTRPVLDPAGLLLGAPLVALAAATAARGLTGRPPANRTTISMGPGGWVSYRDTTGRAPRVIGLRRAPVPRQTSRPWWARLLRATRFS